MRGSLGIGESTKGLEPCTTEEDLAWPAPKTHPVLCASFPLPVDTSAMSGEKTFTKITGGAHRFCGLSKDKKLYCWGLDQVNERENEASSSDYGLLGQGGKAPDICLKEEICSKKPLPMRLPEGKPVPAFSDVAVLDQQTCGLTSEGEIYCWGRINSGWGVYLLKENSLASLGSGISYDPVRLTWSFCGNDANDGTHFQVPANNEKWSQMNACGNAIYLQTSGGSWYTTGENSSRDILVHPHTVRIGSNSTTPPHKLNLASLLGPGETENDLNLSCINNVVFAVHRNGKLSSWGHTGYSGLLGRGPVVTRPPGHVPPDYLSFNSPTSYHIPWDYTPRAVETEGVANYSGTTKLLGTFDGQIVAEEKSGKLFYWGRTYGATPAFIQKPVLWERPNLPHHPKITRVLSSLFRISCLETTERAYCKGYNSNGMLGRGKTMSYPPGEPYPEETEFQPVGKE